MWFWDKFAEPPSDLSLLAGDAIHNARSALDHLGFSLALHGANSSGIALTDEEMAHIQFPITDSLARFETQIKRGRLKGVDQRAIAMIRVRQPFQTITPPIGQNPLWLVHRLDINDKHRELMFVGPVIINFLMGWPEEFKQLRFRDPAGPNVYAPGPEIGSYVFPSPQSEADVEVDLTVGLHLHGAEPLSHTIPDLLDLWVNSVERVTIRGIADTFLP